jgi:hypothetical protein
MAPGCAILIGAVGTWVIAVAALWDRLSTFFLKLYIERYGFSGTTATHQNEQKARYYFVRVKNPCRRIVSAHEVQAVITKIEQSSDAGRVTIFEEVMPLPWQRQEYQTLPPRTIGTPMLAGVFFVQQDGTLGITPAVAPGGTVASHFPPPQKGKWTLWITLMALSIEVDSRPVRLRIEWSGQWHDGKAEIERQCIVTIEP